jgi:hypothetical protein
MSKVELAIENLWTMGTVHRTACAVLLAALMEEFGDDVTATDIDQCIDHLQTLKADLKDD